MKKYIYLVCAICFLIAGIFIYNINSKDNISTEDIKELPLKVEAIDVSLNVVEGEYENEIVAKYTNNSQDDITSISLEVKLKDTEEVIQLRSNETVKIGQTSSEFNGKGPNSGKNEDVEILKYKVVLNNSTYLEYDATTNTYNWS